MKIMPFLFRVPNKVKGSRGPDVYVVVIASWDYVETDFSVHIQNQRMISPIAHKHYMFGTEESALAFIKNWWVTVEELKDEEQLEEIPELGVADRIARSDSELRTLAGLPAEDENDG